jgi:hypothetical protein
MDKSKSEILEEVRSSRRKQMILAIGSGVLLMAGVGEIFIGTNFVHVMSEAGGSYRIITGSHDTPSNILSGGLYCFGAFAMAISSGLNGRQAGNLENQLLTDETTTL